MLNATTSGLSALPGTAQPFACTQALWRFLRHPNVTLPALIEPIRETARPRLARAEIHVGLVIHDWSMLHLGRHTTNRDRFQRTHAADLGYELGSALLVEPDRGTPLGPMELRLRSARKVHTTRLGGAPVHSSHLDEVVEVMEAARGWGLERPLVHIIDREVDSVWHDRLWHALGYWFLVRADAQRVVRWDGQALPLSAIAAAVGVAGGFTDTGQNVTLSDRRTGRLQIAETAVVLDRPAQRTIAGRKRTIRGVPLRLRLVLARIVAADGRVLAEWLLLTNVPALFGAATIVQWYYWRWRIESYHKLLKSAGQQVERWQQETGERLAKRLVLVSMACLTVWALMQDESAAAAALRGVLVRLSGRQMKWGVESTAPALLAGLEKLLAVLDLLEHYDPQELRRLVRSALPSLFNSS